MILRICDNGDERVEPASVDLVERLLAPEASLADGTSLMLSSRSADVTA